MDFLNLCEHLAKTKFALKDLRQAQKDVLNLIDKHHFVLATLPTGAGKTYLYAIPALIYTKGPILVLSPLLSLMRDQERRMKEAQIPCALFTSDQSEMERKEAWQSVNSGQARLIFASPERFMLPSFLSACSRAKLSMVVVDEAHCVMSWGHHFRPEYAEIAKILTQLNPPKILAMTATAGRPSRAEIIKKVFPKAEIVQEYVSNPIGKHLFIESKRLFTLEEQWSTCLGLIQKTESQKIILYVQSRQNCEDLAKKLRKQNLHSIVYHAGLSKQERYSAETYVHNTTQKTVICATTAFGMGVNVNGISLVIVYGFPNNIEELFQMLGRAGRSGEPSRGVLLWTGRDPIKREFIFKKEFPVPTLFMDKCSRFVGLMPKKSCEKTFVEKKKLLEYSSIEDKGNLEHLLSGMRICQIVEDPVLNEDYLQIEMKEKLMDLLDELPQGITKRRKVLEGLALLTKQEWATTKNAQTIVRQKLLVDASEMDPEYIYHVLQFYEKEKRLSWKNLPKEQTKNGVIFKNSFTDLQKQLPKYVTARNLFSQSLQELQKLSLASQCRLSSSFQFFATKQTSASRLCYQCDLCIKAPGTVSSKGNIKKSNFEDSFTHFVNKLGDIPQYEKK